LIDQLDKFVFEARVVPLTDNEQIRFEPEDALSKIEELRQACAQDAFLSAVVDARSRGKLAVLRVA
jgi:hypothetical protein